jgi:hypothetical protein
LKYTVSISQNTPKHPGSLVDQDVAYLFADNTFADATLETRLSPQILAEGSFKRPDAGVATITIAFVLGGIAKGVLSEAGKDIYPLIRTGVKDIYSWVKTCLSGLMAKKKETETLGASKYRYEPPSGYLR